MQLVEIEKCYAREKFNGKPEPVYVERKQIVDNMLPYLSSRIGLVGVIIVPVAWNPLTNGT